MDYGNNTNRRKVVVVGAGAVGSTFCYVLAQNGLAGEIVKTDRNTGLTEGQVSEKGIVRRVDGPLSESEKYLLHRPALV